MVTFLEASLGVARSATTYFDYHRFSYAIVPRVLNFLKHTKYRFLQRRTAQNVNFITMWVIGTSIDDVIEYKNQKNAGF